LTAGLLDISSSQGQEKIRRSAVLFTEILSENQNNPRILLLRASALTALRDGDNAREDFRRIVRLNPEDPALLDETGVGLLRLDCFDEAIQCLERALLLTDPVGDPERYFSIRFNTALACFYLGHLQRATEELQAVVDAQPDNYQGYSLLGNIYEYREQYDRAERLYRKAVKMAVEPSDRARQYWFLGELYRRHGYYEQAIDIFRRGVKLYPDDYANMFGVWESTIGLGNPPERLNDCLLIAEKFAPKNLRARFTLAILYLAGEQLEKALAEFELFLAATEKNPREWGRQLKPEIRYAGQRIAELNRALSK